MDEDDENDDFVPRKLFLFNLDEFQKVSRAVVPRGANNTDADLPITSKDTVGDHVKESVNPSKEKKTQSMDRRFRNPFNLEYTQRLWEETTIFLDDL